MSVPTRGGARAGQTRGAMVLKNPAAPGAQGFEKPQVRGGNGFEKLGEMGCLASENRQSMAQNAPRCTWARAGMRIIRTLSRSRKAATVPLHLGSRSQIRFSDVVYAIGQSHNTCLLAILRKSVSTGNRRLCPPRKSLSCRSLCAQRRIQDYKSFAHGHFLSFTRISRQAFQTADEEHMTPRRGYEVFR
jgi:hypothetical protein